MGLETKNFARSIRRTLAWIPELPKEPEILHRLGVQNKGLCTKQWRVVDRKKDSKGQQLVILIEQMINRTKPFKQTAVLQKRNGSPKSLKGCKRNQSFKDAVTVFKMAEEPEINLSGEESPRDLLNVELGLRIG